MGKYTYTASLVDESINILRVADRELGGTNAAIVNAVNTILNARGAERLAFDFDDILTLTDYARDDIAAVTKEILNKQREIEEYENAPWWKKLFASIGMALLKYFEGHGQAIEYIFDLAVSLAGFIGGLFNSEFKASCKEFVDKEHVDNWFTQQFIGENGLFKDINRYSIFAYDSTAANIIEFGGSLLSIGASAAGSGLLVGGHMLYKSIDKLVEETNSKAIVTSTPIISPKLKEIFEIGEVENPPTSQETPPEDELIADPPRVPDEEGGEQFTHQSGGGSHTGNVEAPEEFIPPTGDTFEPTTDTPNPETPQTSTPDSSNVYVPENDIMNPDDVLFGTPEDTTESTVDTLVSHGGGGNAPVNIPKATSADAISKKTAGSFSDLINGSDVRPVSSKPLSSKDKDGIGTIGTPLASGVVAAGAAGWGAKTYIDKRNASDKKEEDKELDAEKWDEDAKDLSIDYEDGRLKDVEGDYLSPEDELAFTE